ncbi:MAG: hypothetical protein ACYSWP_24740 [Planctomycetota bacterium]
MSFEDNTQPEMELSVKESIFQFTSFCWKVICFLAPTAMVYVFTIPMVLYPIGFFAQDLFFSPLGLVIVLAFDVVWVIIMIKLPFKDKRLRKVLIWFVLTVSASLLLFCSRNLYLTQRRCFSKRKYGLWELLGEKGVGDKEAISKKEADLISPASVGRAGSIQKHLRPPV